LLAFDNSHHTCFANSGVHLVNAAQLERVDYPAGGVNLFKAKFRVGMQVTPKGGQLGMVLNDLRKSTASGSQECRPVSICIVCHPGRLNG
jgi:hypothetical protein